MPLFKWRIGQVGIIVKKHHVFTRVKEADLSSLTLNKSQLTSIAVDWVFSGSRAFLWREFSWLSRQGGLALQNDPWTVCQWGGEPSLLSSMLPLTGLQHLRGGHDPTQATQCGTVDRKVGLRHWDLLWAQNWLRRQAESQTFKALFPHPYYKYIKRNALTPSCWKII